MPLSLPALAASISAPEQSWPCDSAARPLARTPFVPAYRVPVRGASKSRIPRLADAVALLAERLDRLTEAYGHWSRFDAAAYFDLQPRQAHTLVRIERLGATLDVTLYADLLAPAFRGAERYWAEQFCPAYHAAGSDQNDAFSLHFQRHIVPAMRRRLQQAQEEIAAAGELLYRRGDVTFLSVAAAPDERSRHLHRLSPGDEDLTLLYLNLPTLTLSRSLDLLQIGR